jgi:hypothetical protein
LAAEKFGTRNVVARLIRGKFLFCKWPKNVDEIREAHD